MASDSVLECPFCGSERVGAMTESRRFSFAMDENWKLVMCEDCTATSGTFQTYAEAITAWNGNRKQRPSVQKVSKKITIIKENNV